MITKEDPKDFQRLLSNIKLLLNIFSSSQQANGQQNNNYFQ